MTKHAKSHTAPDGITWSVTVQSPGSSNAIIMFRHPDGSTSRLDRYNWILSNGPEARSVTSRLVPEKVLEQLDAGTITRLFQRSMPVSRKDPLGGPGPGERLNGNGRS
ncbi:MAG: hypothetical protein JWL95_313 [Gemmatimonadetes bacterium]|nr:hypothetical protein [Gemmatimonadota bacterium]